MNAYHEKEVIPPPSSGSANKVKGSTGESFPALSDTQQPEGESSPAGYAKHNPGIKEMLEKERKIARGEQYKTDDTWLRNTRKKLLMILSTHVDDLKGGARKEVALSLLKYLEENFGTCKAEWRCFNHTGV